MTFRAALVCGLVALSTWACGPGGGGGAAVGVDPDATPLRVCLEDNDPPRSELATESGFDLELMAEVAARSGRRFEAVWIPSDPKIIELEESSFPFRAMRRGECNALASIPGGGALGEDGENVDLSRAYYGGGFELVAPATVAPDLFALRGRPVSVLSVSVAHMAAVHLGMDWYASLSAPEQLEALERGRVDAALIFGPSLAGLGRGPREDFELPVALRWNFHVGTRRGVDPALAEGVDRALGELLEEGRVEELLRRYDIPLRGPYATTSTNAAVEALREEAAARGE